MLVGRFSGPSRVTSVPSISMRPLLGSMKPAIMRSKVDLPQPEGPRMAQKSPAPTVEVERLDRSDRAE